MDGSLLVNNSNGATAKAIFDEHVRGLAQACRSLRAEAMSMFWGSNRFLFDLRDHESTRQSLVSIQSCSKDVIASLRNIEFAPAYWQPVQVSRPLVTIQADRDKDRLQVVAEHEHDWLKWERDNEVRVEVDYTGPGRNEIRHAERLVEKIEAAWPHYQRQTLSRRDLERLMRFMGPHSWS